MRWHIQVVVEWTTPTEAGLSTAWWWPGFYSPTTVNTNVNRNGCGQWMGEGGGWENGKKMKVVCNGKPFAGAAAFHCIHMYWISHPWAFPRAHSSATHARPIARVSRLIGALRFRCGNYHYHTAHRASTLPPPTINGNVRVCLWILIVKRMSWISYHDMMIWPMCLCRW